MYNVVIVCQLNLLLLTRTIHNLVKMLCQLRWIAIGNGNLEQLELHDWYIDQGYVCLSF